MVATRVNRGIISQTGKIPQSLQLIEDVYPLRVLETKQVVSEASGQTRPVLRITGVFQKADEPNQNRRKYPYKVLAEAVKKIQEDIGERAVLGELSHPDPKSGDGARIHLDNVSHVITKLWMEGKYVYGTAEILEDLPSGKILAGLIRNKIRVGVSSRGVGDMEVVNEGLEDEEYIVKDGYTFVTWDAVAEPSVREAIVVHLAESRDRLMTRRTKDPKKALVLEINEWLKGR